MTGARLAARQHLDDLRRDAGQALRLLRRAPAFAAVTVATLALGIGAVTVIFAVVDPVLLRPLPFPESERLAMVRPNTGARLSDEYLDQWRRRSRTLADMAGWFDVRANLTGTGAPVEVHVDRTTANFFAVLGMPPLHGRTFTAVPDLGLVEPEAVLSYGFWQRHYGGAPDIVGRSITLDGAAYTIVGIMPRRFVIRTTERAESRAEIWTPTPLIPDEPTGMGGNFNVIARRLSGYSIDQVQSDLGAIARSMEAAQPSYSHDWIVQALPLLDATIDNVRPTLLAVFAAVGILLLLACANVANLFLNRASSRQTELVIRRSLGATPGRLTAQLLTESFVLAVLGGTLGFAVAAWATQALIAAVPADAGLPRLQDAGINLRIAGFALLVTLFTAVVYGIVPAITAVRVSSRSATPRDERGSSAGRSHARASALLTVSEVALALVLLAAAGLLGRSFTALLSVDPGFDPAQVVTVRTTLPEARYDTDARIRGFATALIEKIEALPGVAAAGTANYLPMSRTGAAAPFEIAGRPEARPEDRMFAWVIVAGGRYFDAMGISLLRGRLPGEGDTETTEPVFVIDETLARRHWPGTDPIGAHLTWDVGQDDTLSGRVVGVVGSVRMTRGVEPPAMAYWWFPNAPNRAVTIVARTTADQMAVTARIASLVAEIDASQPVADVQPLEALVAADLARPRFTLGLLGGFAAAALLMAAIGVYGVVASAVGQRTREIGVRIAVGAQRRDILMLVLGRTAVLVGAGIAVGVASSMALGRLVSGLLFDVSPWDPVTLVSASAFLVAIALLATYLPARRATRVDPVTALRPE